MKSTIKYKGAIYREAEPSGDANLLAAHTQETDGDRLLANGSPTAAIKAFRKAIYHYQKAGARDRVPAIFSKISRALNSKKK